MRLPDHVICVLLRFPLATKMSPPSSGSRRANTRWRSEDSFHAMELKDWCLSKYWEIVECFLSVAIFLFPAPRRVVDAPPSASPSLRGDVWQWSAGGGQWVRCLWERNGKGCGGRPSEARKARLEMPGGYWGGGEPGRRALGDFGGEQKRFAMLQSPIDGKVCIIH
jgi:hypothetical protein